MPYLASNPTASLGKSIGDGQCVAYVRAASGAPHTSSWKRGELVKDARVTRGTVIATFDSNGRYGNHTSGTSHTAIFLQQLPNGIRVLDQWVSHKRDENGKTVAVPQPVHERVIRFRGAPRLENNGNNYYVVE